MDEVGGGLLMRCVWFGGWEAGWSRQIWVPEDWSGSVRGRVACARQVPMAGRSELRRRIRSAGHRASYSFGCGEMISAAAGIQ
ncbi:hypothetical protein NA56DRAFT_648746 [Hyaloscypha hepaticicola]|uniref:Uncharacterized protein n=1 Tax=Hyaloscypha hepaticicola TaxID=2082293 RepID=A0A2J6PTH2_9HELO|nr:hypothetical protein NA56DRAFT_648746 [Hyaloscypha hepaticicola]